MQEPGKEETLRTEESHSQLETEGLGMCHSSRCDRMSSERSANYLCLTSSFPAFQINLASLSDIKPKFHHITVLDDILLAFDPELAGFAGFGKRA